MKTKAASLLRRELPRIDKPEPKKLAAVATRAPVGIAPKAQSRLDTSTRVRGQLAKDGFDGAPVSRRLSLDGGPVKNHLAPLGTLSGGAALTGLNKLKLTGAMLAGGLGALGDLNAVPSRVRGDVQESAEEAIGEALSTGDAQPVADWLRTHPNPEDRAAFYDYLFSLGDLAGSVLNDVNNLSTSDKQLLANSLDDAYRSGAVTDEELSAAVSSYGRGSGPGETNEGLADIVARTGNADLISTYAQRELEIARQDGGTDSQRAQTAASVLATLSPSKLQEFLAANPDDVETLFQYINDGAGEDSPVLGQLLDVASRIQPPTPESIGVFEKAVPKLGENPASREAAANFFNRNTEAVLAHYQDASGSLKRTGQEVLAQFFANTLFTEPSFPGQEAFRDDLLRKLDELNTALGPEANANPPSLQAKETARLLGSLVGTIEGGFQFAVENLNAKNEAIDSFADFLFQAGELIPDLPLPGAGLVKDFALEELKEWVTGHFKEDAQNPAEALPFHEVFGETIANPDLHTDYESARSTVLTNILNGLVEN